SFSSLLLLEGREKRRFKKMMSQYLSPAVLNEVVNKHEEFAHAEVGRKENVSMLFSDIRGFTNMSEHFPAEVVVEILNHYFSQMTDAIFLTQGTIDKFIGDAIMAFWGAPIRTETHAKDATLASLEMLERLKEVKIWLKEKKYPSLSIGIGLHTGDVILGNIGSEQKLDYTIIGDNVNLASRVEGLTKNYGCEILLTESTYNALAGFIPCRKVDLVRVKGKNKPIGIYQPLVNPTRAGDKEFKVAELLAQQYQEAFTYYLEKKWEQVESILKTFPEDDYPTKIILERCRSYKIEAPPDDWDGVFTMTTK
ncbi:MAG: adenylate/guanylate cyclase domain-containing protein, partial [Gammaproteobacteria bacterium]|nr:adenylate/guanylate cyclase domain-containing protein [Gammaproteobacteria bacterium]